MPCSCPQMAPTPLSPLRKSPRKLSFEASMGRGSLEVWLQGTKSSKGKPFQGGCLQFLATALWTSTQLSITILYMLSIAPLKSLCSHMPYQITRADRQAFPGAGPLQSPSYQYFSPWPQRLAPARRAVQHNFTQPQLTCPSSSSWIMQLPPTQPSTVFCTPEGSVLPG